MKRRTKQSINIPKPDLSTSDRRYDKQLSAFVVFVFNVLETEFHYTTLSKIARITHLSVSTVSKVRFLAERGRMSNRRQVRTVQRLAEAAGLQQFKVPD